MEDTKAPYCQRHSAFAAFDFWLGDWQVRAANGTDIVGTNSIKKAALGCAVMENWRASGGGQGVSINYFNPNSGIWRQVWAGGAGYAIDISGGLTNTGEMLLTGEIFYYRDGRTAPFRGTWTPNKDGTVRQFFEEYDKTANTWQPWFDGIYTRRAN